MGNSLTQRTMTVDKYLKKKRQVIRYLKDKGINETVDMTLIDELIFNMQVADSAKLEIFPAEGVSNLLVNMREADKEPFLVANPAIAIYNNAFKTIKSIAISLGMTPADRHKLGLNSPKEKKDSLDKLLTS
jgi:P27 family predicted phage terminase small subunit